MARGEATSGNSHATEYTLRDIATAVESTAALGISVTAPGSKAAYDGTEIEVTGLEADTAYELVSITMRLTGGTAGNSTQPSIGEATGFTQGDMNDRYQMSGSIDKDVARTVDTLLQGVPIVADANGKLYIKGASPAATDSTLSWRVDLRTA